jgi:hypothetical protein
MPSGLSDDRGIDELLRLAGLSIADPAARAWMGDALAGAQAIAAGERRPSPAEHNAPLDTIGLAAVQLIAAFNELRRHPHAHGAFWRCAAFGPIRADKFERVDVMLALNIIHDAARGARSSRTGRPRDFRKQQVVNLVLAFSARFSTATPSSDVSNFFPQLAERFYERSTGLSVEGKGCGIGRQITIALRRLPIEMERAKLLNETRHK